LPWLYAISGNLMRMHYRTEERRLRAYARAGTILGTEQDTVRFDEVADRLDAVSRGPAIAVALAGLTVGLREVLLLHAWAGLSNDEIAEAVGCSSGAVRVRLSRARERMERQLSAEGETSYR
jgi:RNA polymerase sigma factor (sigma-70 family)